MLLPTVPEKAITPPVPACSVSAVAPLRVLEKLIFAPAGEPVAFVLSMVGLLLNTTGPVMPIVPAAVVMLP